jgi:hypothetical protein
LKASFYGLPLEEAKPEIKPSEYFLLVKNQPYLKKGVGESNCVIPFKYLIDDKYTLIRMQNNGEFLENF